MKGGLKKMNKKGFWGGFFVVLIIAAVIGAIGYNVAYGLTTGTETITIKEKWVKYQDDDAKYLVSSEDGEVFEISDTFIKWRFDSSDLYAEIDEGETYKIKTQGWRFAFWSNYKNILKVELID